MTNGTRADLRELFHKGQLTIGISELSRMTGVSPRQLRYWQKRGTLFLRTRMSRAGLACIH
ncbi:MerR family DNA-binding transcriptional regulator [Lactiplantibacillus argentoratensis]|uniref:MerR family DNA-binding transcriptional regulator n=1 Tax=Lactiplantibacillus argentoratensis TaxID=271881 RepID=UPI003D7F1564